MTTDRMTTVRPHRRCRLAALGAVTGLVVSLAAGAVVAPATAAPVTVHGAGVASTVTYLALGDSLSVGFQPGQGRTKQGYVDVLSLHASDGWWSADASAPRGVGGLTNELAAFPSLHAGWALWVAISLQRNAPWPALRWAVWAYAAGTSVVVSRT